jgi:hypothetical protein
MQVIMSSTCSDSVAVGINTVHGAIKLLLGIGCSLGNVVPGLLGGFLDLADLLDSLLLNFRCRDLEPLGRKR